MGTHTVFFVGKPASGKGTQAALLSKTTTWPVASMSAAMWEIAAAGDAVGRKMQETMDAGILMPAWLASYVYLKSLFSVTEDGSIIFDGTSRTLPESETILDSVKWLGRPFTIFHLNISDEEVRTRVALRRKIESRTDDRVVDKRLEEYYANTEPAIAFYRDAGALIELDGARPPEDIAADVRRALGLT